MPKPSGTENSASLPCKGRDSRNHIHAAEQILLLKQIVLNLRKKMSLN